MFCVSCGKELADGGKFCPHCGAKTDGEMPVVMAAAPAEPTRSKSDLKKEQKAALKAERKSAKAAAAEAAAEPVPIAAPAEKAGGVAGSIILVIFMVLVGALTVPLIFAAGFETEMGHLFGDFAGRLLGSPFPGIFAGVILLLLVVDLFIVNRRRVRRGFLCGGIGFAVTGICSVALGVFAPLLLSLMGGSWEASLLPLERAFCDVEIFLGICVFVFGVLWMSIYACIGAVKKEGGKAA